MCRPTPQCAHALPLVDGVFVCEREAVLACGGDGLVRCGARSRTATARTRASCGACRNSQRCAQTCASRRCGPRSPRSCSICGRGRSARSCCSGAAPTACGPCATAESHRSRQVVADEQQLAARELRDDARSMQEPPAETRPASTLPLYSATECPRSDSAPRPRPPGRRRSMVAREASA